MSLTSRLPAMLAAILIFGAPAATLVVAPQAAHAQDKAAPAPEASPAPVAAKPSTPVPPPPIAAKESVTNPYGIEALWKEGDFITKGTVIILVIMSMGSWYIMVVKVYEQFRMGRQAKEAKTTFWTTGSVPEGINALKENSPFRFIAESGVQATTHHEGKLLEQIDLNSWVTMSIQRAVENVQSRLQDGLAFLATVGSTAPFVGLFGTVWGIYHALTAIGIAGQASIDKVAGPVGEALIMTAAGLAVAVPAVLGYNWLVRRNKVAMEQVRAFGVDLHMVLMSGGAKTQSGRAANVSRVG